MIQVLVISNCIETNNLITNLGKTHYSKQVQFEYATTADSAIEIFSSAGPFDAIFVDAMIKKLDPTEVCEKMMDISGSVPFIFMGTDTMINDRVSAEVFESNAANQKLLLPITVENFKAAVDEIIQSKMQNEFQESLVDLSEDHFMHIKVKNFYLFDKIPYEVFIKITPKRFSKVLDKDEEYREAFIQRFVKKGVRYFYLKKEDHLKFLEQSANQIINVFKKIKLEPINVIQAQIKAASVVQEILGSIGYMDIVQVLVDQITLKTQETYRHFYDIKKIIKIFPIGQRTIAEKSILTMYICQGMLEGMGWNSDLSRLKLGLSALVHDCTLSNDELTFIQSHENAEFGKYNIDEKKEFLEHPVKAGQIAAAFPGVPDIELIVKQHHEMPNGSGFPKGFNSFKINSLSAVFIIAQDFAANVILCDKDKATLNTLISSFKDIYNTGNFKEGFNAFEKMLKN